MSVFNSPAMSIAKMIASFYTGGPAGAVAAGAGAAGDAAKQNSQALQPVQPQDSSQQDQAMASLDPWTQNPGDPVSPGAAAINRRTSGYGQWKRRIPSSR